MSNQLPNDTAKNALIARAIIALAITVVAMKIHAEVSITFSSTPDGINQQQDGTALDTSFTFELGTFRDSFVPTASNTDQWNDNWVTLTNSVADGGGSVPEATTGYRNIGGIFGSYDGFVSTAGLTHNESPFDINKQGFIWGYNSRGPGVNEWVLITNDDTDGTDEEWEYPLGDGDLTFNETWDVAGADNAIIGGINFLDDKNDFIDLETATVIVGGPAVPEPSTALILGVGAATLGLRRRARKRR